MINNRIQHFMKIQKETYYFKIQAYDVKILHYFHHVWRKISSNFSLNFKGPIFLPLKKKKIVLLKSPHVHKKAREMFIFKKYSYLYIISFENIEKKKITLFLNTIQKNLIPGSSFKMVKCVKKDSNFQPINS